MEGIYADAADGQSPEELQQLIAKAETDVLAADGSVVAATE